MNKKNKILVGCLALLLALSVGYALFSDTITINGTATAKGDFQITAEVINMNDYPDIVGDGVSKGIVENPTITVVDNVVTSSVTLGAPGSHHYFGIKFKNTGTIPAKLSSIIDNTNNYIVIDKSLESDGVDVWYYPNGNSKGLNALLYADDGWMLDYEDFPIEDRMFINSIDKGVLDAILDPGEEACFLIEYSWSLQDTVQQDEQELNWNLEFNYEQVTN